MRYPEFRANWELKRLRHDSNNSALLLVDTQSFPNHRRVPVESTLPERSRYHNYVCAFGLIFLVEKQPPTMGRTFDSRKNALVTDTPVTFSMASPMRTSKGPARKLSVEGVEANSLGPGRLRA